MKTLIELFRDSVAFKVFVGLFAFFMTQQVSIGFGKATDDPSSNTIEISFEQKFLEFNNMSLNPHHQ